MTDTPSPQNPDATAATEPPGISEGSETPERLDPTEAGDAPEPRSELAARTGTRPDMAAPRELRVPTSPQREHIIAEAEALRRYIEEGGALAYFRANQPHARVRATFLVDRDAFNRITAQLRAERTGNGPWIWTPKRGLHRGPSAL